MSWHFMLFTLTYLEDIFLFACSRNVFFKCIFICVDFCSLLKIKGSLKALVKEMNISRPRVCTYTVCTRSRAQDVGNRLPAWFAFYFLQFISPTLYAYCLAHQLTLNLYLSYNFLLHFLSFNCFLLLSYL